MTSTNSLPYAPIHTYHSGAAQPSKSSASGVFQSINPANSLPLADVHTSSPADVDACVSSARAAFSPWSSTPPSTRSKILLKAASLLRARNDSLATIETHDTGKPFSETSTVDVATGVDVLEYYARLIVSDSSPLNDEAITIRAGATVRTTKEPLGVCVGIGAWNYPLQIALWKSAPCLAAGNTMVYKPSEVTPLHGPVLAALYSEAGLPAGVFNVVNGGGDVGAQLTGHKDVAKVSFTGQVSTGRKVAARAAGCMKYITMELGGKSALVIMPDMDSEAEIDRAVDGAMMANFYSSGQVCTNGTRVLVPAALKSRFEAALLLKMPFVRLGPSMDPATNFGPLVSREHHAKVLGYIRHGIKVDRATLLAGGAEAPTEVPAGCESGFWVRPTVFTDCTDGMRIAREEIFGPVMCILAYGNVEEAVHRANNSELGLAAGVFGRDVQRAKQVVARLNAGIRWVNTWGESPAEMAVGGWGLSGLGSENGRKGLEAWCRTQSTLVEEGGMASVFCKL